MEQKDKKENTKESEELCCADNDFDSIDCAPKENSEFQCGCGGCC